MARDERQQGNHGIVSALRGALAGPIAGVCSRFLTCKISMSSLRVPIAPTRLLPRFACCADPPDTIKARLQIQGAAISHGGPLYTGTWDAVVQVAGDRGRHPLGVGC